MEIIVKWMKDSGLKVNEKKTELCLFNRKSPPTVSILVGGQEVTSSKQMNVLGVFFDSTLSWAPHVNKALLKANSMRFAIKMVSKFFNKKEMTNIIAAYYYSTLYYNAEIWLIPTLSPLLKQKLLSNSANTLRIAINNYDRYLSFDRIHKLADRATPDMMLKYKHVLLLYKAYNDVEMGADWPRLNFNQNFNRRVAKFKSTDESRYRIGKNQLSNRLTKQNKAVECNDINKTYNSYKLIMKKQFFQLENTINQKSGMQCYLNVCSMQK